MNQISCQVHSIDIPPHTNTTAAVAPMVVVDGTLIIASNHLAGAATQPAVLIDLAQGAISGAIQLPAPARAIAICGTRLVAGLRAPPWVAPL